MRRDLWLFLFGLGAALFSWPLMAIFQDSLIAYLFLIWLSFIMLIGVAVHFSEREEGEG